MSEAAKYYAVYSQSQVDCGGPLYEFRKPEGDMIIGTAWSYTPGCPEVVYTDKEDLGEVLGITRTVREAQQKRKEG